MSSSFCSGRSGGGGGGGTGVCSPKNFPPNLKIRMLKNKTQIAQESIKTTLELAMGPGPLPKVTSLLHSQCVCGNIIFCENPGSASVLGSIDTWQNKEQSIHGVLLMWQFGLNYSHGEHNYSADRF